MSLFDQFKKMFKKKEEKNDLFSLSDLNFDEKSEKSSEENKNEVKMNETRASESVVSSKEDQVSKKELSTIEVINTNEAIESWEKTLNAAQQHPLSQVKIINTQILEELTNVLRSMNDKMKRLEELDKLDKILNLLSESKAELDQKGINSSFLDSAIKEIESLTIKDKDVLEWIERQERVTAKQLADYVNLSRSTASFRLNRLKELGLLEKEAIGKKIFYRVKKKNF